MGNIHADPTVDHGFLSVWTFNLHSTTSLSKQEQQQALLAWSDTDKLSDYVFHSAARRICFVCAPEPREDVWVQRMKKKLRNITGCPDKQFKTDYVTFCDLTKQSSWSSCKKNRRQTLPGAGPSKESWQGKQSCADYLYSAAASMLSSSRSLWGSKSAANAQSAGHFNFAPSPPSSTPLVSRLTMYFGTHMQLLLTLWQHKHSLLLKRIDRKNRLGTVG